MGKQRKGGEREREREEGREGKGERERERGIGDWLERSVQESQQVQHNPWTEETEAQTATKLPERPGKG